MHPLRFQTLKLIIVLLAGLLGHAGVSSADLSRPSTAAPASGAQGATKGLMFQASSSNTTAYLLGSLHIAKADFYPMSPKVEAAYRQADTVAVEADATNTTALQGLMGKLTYTAPDTLQQHLSPATWRSLTELFGPAAEQFQALKPALLAGGLVIELGKSVGLDATQGADVHFIGRAKADGKRLVELESLEFQANLLDSLSDEEGESMLTELIDSVKRRELFTELDQLMAAWKSGDAPALLSLFEASNEKTAASRRMAKALFDDRNEGMADKLRKLMTSGRKVFVVVGAGHLVGQNSVIELLRKQGMTVTQVR